MLMTNGDRQMSPELRQLGTSQLIQLLGSVIAMPASLCT